MKKALCVVLVGLLAQVASANLLVNGDFEQPVLAEGTEVAVSSGQVPGWTTGFGIGTVSPAVANYPNTIVGNTTGIAYATSNGLFLQTVGAIQPNTTYTLNVDMGSSQYWYGLNTFAGAEIMEVTSAGGWVADLAYAGFNAEHAIADPGPGKSTNVTVIYTTGATVTPGNQIAVVFGINGPNGGSQPGYGAVWDNAVMTPEPASMGLLILGSIAGLLRRRK